MKRTYSLDDCQLIELPQHQDRAGNLTAINNGIDLPQRIERVFYLYDVPTGADRGGHAHRNLFQYIIAASGSFEVLLDDGSCKRRVLLNRPHQALLVTPWVWSQLVNFSGGAIAMVLATMPYNESDYLRDYNDFIQLRHGNHTI